MGAQAYQRPAKGSTKPSEQNSWRLRPAVYPIQSPTEQSSANLQAQPKVTQANQLEVNLAEIPCTAECYPVQRKLVIGTPRNKYEQEAGYMAIVQKKKSKQAGTFIGDKSAVHLHIDIAKPHLKFQGATYSLAPKGQGYKQSMLQAARDALNGNELDNISGVQACRNWLDEQL
ncbi:MAG: hypothetical protein HC940_05190 [Acaryochloris sp. SU_5_25]|nr:hypothetical protein [Acaryochloris sp. SU_5_25]